MHALLTRAATDPGSASQLLQSLTSASSVPPALLPRVLQFLATAAGGPLPTRQNVFVVITAECDPKIVSPKAAAETLASLIVESTSTGVQFYDNNALFRCLVSLVSISSGAAALSKSIELDNLIVAVCNYHRVVSLQFIDVCSKLQMISEAVLCDVLTMLCCCSLESSRPYRVVGIVLSGALQQRCFRVLLDFVADVDHDERCRGAIALLAQALWGPSRLLELTPMADAMVNQLGLLVRRDAIDGKIALEICNALGCMSSGLSTDDVADHQRIVEIVQDFCPSLRKEALLRPTLSAILSALLAQSQADTVLELAAHYVHLLADNRVALESVLVHQKAKIYPANPLWLDQLAFLMESFFADSSVPAWARHSALLFTLDLVEHYQGVFSDDIMRHCLLPFCGLLQSLGESDQVSLRSRLASLLANIAVDTFSDLLDVVLQGVASPYDTVRDMSLDTLQAAFRAKLPHPLYEHCVQVFDALITLIASHREPPLCLRAIQALTGITTDNNGAIRYVAGDVVVVSSYIFAGSRYYDERTSTVLPISKLVTVLAEVFTSDPGQDVFEAALGALHHLCSDTIIASEIDVPLLYAKVSRYVSVNLQHQQSLVDLTASTLSRYGLAYQLLLCLLPHHCRIDEISCRYTIAAFAAGLRAGAMRSSELPASHRLMALCLQGLTLLALTKPELISGQVSEVLSSCDHHLLERISNRHWLQFLHTFLTEVHQYCLLVNREWSPSTADMKQIFTLNLQLVSQCHLDNFESRLAYRCLRLSFTFCTFEDKLALIDQNKTVSSVDFEMLCLMDFMHTRLHNAWAHQPSVLDDDLSERSKQRSWSWITPVSIVTISTCDGRPDAHINVRGTAIANSHFILRSPSLSTPGVVMKSQYSSAHVLHLLKTFTGSLSCSCARGLDPGDQLERSLAILDQIPCHDTMKVGVVYVRSDQTEESAILSNIAGSATYQLFLNCLGRPLVLKGAKSYTGGLDRHDNIDGRLTLTWMDSLTEICFHVATMIPNRLVCAQGEHKKRHIGNDFVNIIYLDDIHCQYDPDTLSSQLNFVQIIVTNFSDGYFSIRLHSKPNVPAFWSLHDCMTFHINDIGQVVRQLIIQAQIACWTMQPQKLQETAWQVRYQQIQRIAGRHSLPDSNSSSHSLIIRR